MWLYGMALAALLVSALKDRGKTRDALRRGWRSLVGILSPMATVFLVTAFFLAWVPPEFVSRWLGPQSGWLGALGASLVGSVTLIPAFVAFPLAKNLLDAGAGVFPLGVFVSTLMMVGVVTFPVEAKVFGWRLSLGRNLLAYLFSFLVGWGIFLAVSS